MKREWYRYLEAQGFEDIEKRISSAHGDLSLRKDFQTTNQFEAKVNYSIWASRMLEVGNFKSLQDELIWSYHSEGVSRRTIGNLVGLDDRWCSRKILKIREYLMMSVASQCASYG